MNKHKDGFLLRCLKRLLLGSNANLSFEERQHAHRMILLSCASGNCMKTESDGKIHVEHITKKNNVESCKYQRNT